MRGTQEFGEPRRMECCIGGAQDRVAHSSRGLKPHKGESVGLHDKGKLPLFRKVCEDILQL